ncbi:MAG: hypothetical protein PHS41_01350 [Victivallaceae bacterium]|nr:hypothetical protein [Victivallaceae bacterium]
MPRISLSNQKIGKIKPLNGGNLAPPLFNEEVGMNIREPFAQMHLEFARLHDAPLENPGMRLVDPHLIFPRFDADADDPKNYYFEQTDDYLANCIAAGTKVFYRLGPSIEHSIHKYFTHPPKDAAQWSKIAANIIRHYTGGWANGFTYDIEYWEIWNEPDIGPKMWTGTSDEFRSFFRTAAKSLKEAFPHLKIGGPAHAYWNDDSRDFLRFCAANAVPLDFYSYHCYTSDPFALLTQSPAEVRAFLDEIGYAKTEIHLNEWHYVPRQQSKNPEKDLKNMDAAAFITLVLTLWQDTPLDKAAYYTVTTTAWGVFAFRRNTTTKCFSALKTYGEFLRYSERLKADSDTREVAVLAGCDQTGRHAALISCFKTEPQKIEVSGCPAEVTVRVLDENHDLEKIDCQISRGIIQLPQQTSSSIYLLEY